MPRSRWPPRRRWATTPGPAPSQPPRPLPSAATWTRADVRHFGSSVVEPSQAAAFALLSAAAVRQRCHRLLALGLEGKLAHFRIELARLNVAADLVIESTRRRYPSLDVPLHSRWRHFTVDGEDRWAKIDAATAWRNTAERARAAFDLAIVSVLLDAGADRRWRYLDAATGQSRGRSEGLALASLEMFAAGAFSEDHDRRLSVDAAALARTTSAALGRHFQVSARNPLPDIDGRAALLRRLGEVVARRPEVFALADKPRPGGLFDHLVATADDHRLAAPRILCEVLRHLGPIWPSGCELAGVPLGDCWQHPGLKTQDASNGLVPLHKLSQWLSYSLIEPLQAAGFVVSE